MATLTSIWGSGLVVTMVAATGLSGSSATVPETWQRPTAATYGSTMVTNVQVPMSDGTTLVGDVIYPADKTTGQRAKGEFPVLLVQNPYFCDTTEGSLGLVKESAAGTTYYAERGYIFAAICVRGTGRSDGEFDLWGPKQQQDGVELVRWAKDGLERSDGTIGLTEQGAATSVWCATSPQLDGLGGVYCENNDIALLTTESTSGAHGVMPHAIDPGSASRLWDLSARLLDKEN